ncbi:MAG: hypothetical protein A3E83_00750 [Gammaproteobacteria bacterium RIFCSPHIGHO2_12_FULL_41_20]|nr:MAG: hypothetical protein A3E83_00750 [Gammaproteobacteria bacterium RIFCSPHIGHO2_12_FULL_41_20]
MKAKLIIITGCCGMLLSSYVLAGCPSSYCQPKRADICAYQASCTCTDPACNLQNDCLSRSRCCEAFGDIGSMD